ncbi:p53-like transcription factor [Zopfia rhizophila CBS 207.26]|uniref:p53-like transcription factor n=1 Tax=Zopfia rhizophila CBS 207.26 TaxID=1314779 RepID=A0A6A6EBT1_9PEZI|nr:p53-like transcription factor [Zopfia rhizophila CBS 207.26]
MNQLLQPLPLASDVPFTSEQPECIDHIGAHAHHSSFAAGVPDQLRRDGALGHSSSGILNSLPSANGARYIGPRPEAHPPDLAWQAPAVLPCSVAPSPVSAHPQRLLWPVLPKLRSFTIAETNTSSCPSSSFLSHTFQMRGAPSFTSGPVSVWHPHFRLGLRLYFHVPQLQRLITGLFIFFSDRHKRILKSFHRPTKHLFEYPVSLLGSFIRNVDSSQDVFRLHGRTDSSTSAMLPPARSSGMGNPVSPSLGSSARDNYTTSTPGLQRHPHTLSPRHPEVSGYSSLPDTPRSVLPTTMPLPTPGTYSNSALLSYGAQPDRHGEGQTPPFNAQENYVDITSEGAAVTPTIDAKIEKGFFWSSDRVWTCYRRNYFAVSVSFGLTPWIANGRLYLNQGGSKGPEQIQSMAMSLSAAVDGASGKSIELIQHTPKRDKGPQLPMKKELLSPTPPGKSHNDHTYGIGSFHTTTAMAGPQLPLQTEADQSHQYSPASHSGSTHQYTFERIQFKSATANNGKRRAQQQYYHLIVELWANVQNPRDSEPRWVKIATRSSHPVVVRGRSPSHYQNEGPHNAGASRGGSGSGVGGPGHPGLGSNGGPTYSGNYGNGLSGSRSGAMGGSMYRGNTYSLDPSPVGTHSVSSASSLSGGPVEGLGGDQQMLDDDETKAIDGYNGYQYYPAPIYEGIQPKVEGPGLPLPERRIKEEYPGPAAITSSWQVGGCGRFQGMESSRGYYPDVTAHTGY